MLEFLALAAGLEVAAELLRTEQSSVVTTIVRVTNTTSAEFKAVNVECTFLDYAGHAVRTDSIAVFNVKPRETAFAKSRIEDRAWRIQTVSCRAGAAPSE